MPNGVETAVRSLPGGIGFPKIMAEGCQHQAEGVRCLIPQCGCLVQNKQGMRPDITFRMVLRRLRDADQFFQLGKPEVQLTHLPKLPEKNRGL